MEREDLLDQFIQITGVSSADAKSVLEFAGWNLELALANFFEDLAMAGGDAFLTFRNSDAARGRTSNSSRPVDGPPNDPPPPLKQRNEPCLRMGTVAGIRQESACQDEDGEDRQAFYAGGSEHSGQQVLGPESSGDEASRRRKDIISQMLRAAQEHCVPDEGSARSSQSGGAFQGVGYRLGQTSDDSMMVLSPSERGDDNDDRRDVTLQLWRDGFSIDSGPLREYTEPRNVQFLNEIRQGRIPEELLSEAQGGTVHLNMEDHRHEAYLPPKPKVKAFTGKGHVLGSPTPAISTDDSVTASTTTDNFQQPALELSNHINVDMAAPITTVQVRLNDGSRLQVTLNKTHTIFDLRQSIIRSRPEYANRAFILLTTFPSAELTNDSQTLGDAGLLNVSILLRLI